jgi:hypothetical protein
MNNIQEVQEFLDSLSEIESFIINGTYVSITKLALKQYKVHISKDDMSYDLIVNKVVLLSLVENLKGERGKGDDV